MTAEDVKAQLGPLLKGEIRLTEPLKAHTTWRIGGPAEIMVLPDNYQDIVSSFNYAHNHGIPVTVIGNGSNLLISDAGVNGIVIKIAHHLNHIQIEGNNVIAGGGAVLPQVSRRAAEFGLSGLEFGVGIPASVGGAAIMNAGAHGGAMADVVASVKVVTPAGKVETLTADELEYRYRSSSLKGRGCAVIEVTFNCRPADKDKIQAKMQSNLSLRKETQPLNFPNAGSTFKNPQGNSAGRLIELAGGKGLQVGDAQVSTKHANFIVNLGEAKAEEVIKLIEKIQSLVKDKFDLNLELEVQLLGF